MDPDYGARYRELYERHWWWRARERIVLDEIDGLGLPRDAAVLDVGCGDGLLLPALARRFAQVAGVEADGRLLTPASSNLRDRMFVGPVSEYRPSQRFALVTMLDVIEHIEDDVAALRQVSALLAPGGRVLVTVPALPMLWTHHDDINHHHRRYTRDTLTRALGGAGLMVQDCRHLFRWTVPVKLAQRAVEAVRRPSGADTRIPPGPVNAALAWMTGLEARVPGVRRLPVGSSLIAIAARPV